MASPSLHWLLVKQELRRSAAGQPNPCRPRRRHRWYARAAASLPAGPAVTIRHAFPDDAQSLMRLAALDSAELLEQPALVAEVDGELRAALSLRDGAVIADPFHRTEALVDLLLARAAQLAALDAGPGATAARWGFGRILVARLRGNA